MVAVWCNEGPLYKNENGELYSLTINNNIISRYLDYVDEIYMLTRVRKLVGNSSKYSKIDTNDNFKVVELDNCSNLKGILLNSNNVKKNILKYINMCDICFVGLPSILGNMAVSCCKKINKKYIVEVLACPFDSLWNYGTLIGKIMAPIQFFITKIKIKNSDNVVYVSNEFLQNRYPNLKNNIGCSDVIIEDINEENLKKRIEKINNYNDSTIFHIGLIGSLNLGYKGHDTAIKAISQLKEKYNIKLHFLGKGEPKLWSKEINKYDVKENVVLEWMDNIDIFLIPSLQEGLPRSLVEAMSRACPAIGVKTGGIPELISKEYIANKKDYKEIAKMIEIMILDKEKITNQAECNFNKSLEFEKEKLYNKRKKFYKEVINKNEQK